MTAWPELTLPEARVRMLCARANNAHYEIRVWCPANARDTDHLPTIYVLDGRDFFGTFADSLGRLSRRPDATNVGPAIVVAISPVASGTDATARRYADYTPGPAAEEMAAQHETGGAAAFRAFLCHELAPLIEQDFPADPARRILFGHSLAGYFTLHELATNPDGFADYVAISPSIWWDEAKLRNGLTQLASLDEKRAFIAVGQWEGQLPPWQKRHDDVGQVMERRARRAMIERAQDVADDLERALGREQVEFHLFADEDHASVVLVAIARALRFTLGRSGAIRTGVSNNT